MTQQELEEKVASFEKYLNTPKGQRLTEEFAKEMRIEKLAHTIAEQLDFAEGRLIDATNQGVQDEIYKWSGYLQGLRFIQSEL